jgi:hypothetical protein
MFEIPASERWQGTEAREGCWIAGRDATARSAYICFLQRVRLASFILIEHTGIQCPSYHNYSQQWLFDEVEDLTVRGA